MADTLRHRGPDDEGYLAIVGDERRPIELGGADSKRLLPPVDGLGERASILLGHRRLAVLDLSEAGHQPMSNRRRDRWLVYNGEVYNYGELRRELETAGHAFSSGTDTEVVLAAYEEWGEGCLDRLDGMWAFVVLDLARGVLFGSRDRVGVKPLYLAQSGGRFAFASEIKALLELPFIGRTLNTAAAFDFLVLGESGWSEETLFAGVLELPPAAAFRLDLDSWRLERWTHYTLPVTDVGGGVEDAAMREYVAGVRERLRASVSERLRSDVPLGSCLSGGIDSSSIVCTAAEIEPAKDRMAFSASFREPEADERQWAELAARHARVTWLEDYPQPAELLADFDELTRCQELPFAAPSVYAQYRVMRLARRHGVTVLLDGQGGDELLTGYAPFHEVHLAERLRRLDLVGFLRELSGSVNSPAGRGGTTRALARRLARAALPHAVLAARRSRRRGPFEVIAPDLWNAHRDRWELVRVREAGSLNLMLAEMFSGRKLARLLRYEDRSSMWHSIEARAPFADDRELAEYVFSIPGCYKIYRGWSKHLLREAMRGTIPEPIRLRRDKLGFAAPARAWMDELWPSLRGSVSDTMSGLVDSSASGSDLWPRLRTNGPFGVEMAWRIASFAKWRRVFGV